MKLRESAPEKSLTAREWRDNRPGVSMEEALAARTPSKNALCPCDSGRKYKSCCANKDLGARQADREFTRRRHALLEAEGRTVEAILDWYDDDDVGVGPEIAAWLPDDPAWEQLALCWSAYDVASGKKGTRAVEWYLEDHGARLLPEDRRWLEAQLQVHVGIWEVVGVQPGRTVTVMDRLTDITQTVCELNGSKMLSLGDCVVGRVVECDGMVVFSGLVPRTLRPTHADVLIEAVRDGLHLVVRLPKKRLLRPDETRLPGAVHAILSLTVALLGRLDAAPPPQLRTTDGEEMVLCEDRWPLGRIKTGRIEAALGEVEGAEQIDDGEWQITRPGNAQFAAWDNTILGNLRVDGKTLVLETRSVERADLLRDRIAAALPELGPAARSSQAFADLARAAAESDSPRAQEPIPPPEVQDAVQAMMRDHYKRWVDVALPALDGQTPRQATRTKVGREQVDRLLADMEWAEVRKPEWQRFDTRGLRRDLGL